MTKLYEDAEAEQMQDDSMNPASSNEVDVKFTSEDYDKLHQSDVNAVFQSEHIIDVTHLGSQHDRFTYSQAVDGVEVPSNSVDSRKINGK